MAGHKQFQSTVALPTDSNFIKKGRVMGCNSKNFINYGFLSVVYCMQKNSRNVQHPNL